MHNIQTVIFCAGLGLRRRLISSKACLVLVVLLVFSYYIYSPVCQVADFYHLSVPPWLFLFFLSFFTVLLVHGGLCLLLFSDVGDNDGYSYLMIHRCGRKLYMAGQLLEIFITAFLYAFTIFLFSILFILPVIGWDVDWGTLIRTLSENSGLVQEQTGATLSFIVDAEVLSVFTPIQATLACFFCLWFSAAFVGVLICFCRVYFEKTVGIIAAGFFIALSLFVLALGLITVGSWLQFLSPLTWSNFMYLDWYYSGLTPSPVYAFSVWGISMAVMSTAAVIGFDRRDIQ